VEGTRKQSSSDVVKGTVPKESTRLKFRKGEGQSKTYPKKRPKKEIEDQHFYGQGEGENPAMLRRERNIFSARGSRSKASNQRDQEEGDPQPESTKKKESKVSQWLSTGCRRHLLQGTI